MIEKIEQVVRIVNQTDKKKVTPKTAIFTRKEPSADNADKERRAKRMRVSLVV